jgi:hypothetical protein
MTGARTIVFGALLALAVALAQNSLVRLVEASGAREQPAFVLVVLLAAFIGVLAAVMTRMLRLPSATAPTALVLGWTLVPVALAALPSASTSFLAGDAALTGAEALALAAASVAGARTHGVPADG